MVTKGQKGRGIEATKRGTFVPQAWSLRNLTEASGLYEIRSLYNLSPPYKEFAAGIKLLSCIFNLFYLIFY